MTPQITDTYNTLIEQIEAEGSVFLGLIPTKDEGPRLTQVGTNEQVMAALCSIMDENVQVLLMFDFCVKLVKKEKGYV